MATVEIRNPATGAVIDSREADHAHAIHEKFLLAQKAQLAWAARPLSDRIAVVNAFAGLLEQHLEEGAKIQCAETGKPITQARNEIRGTLGRIQFFVEHVAERSSTRRITDDPANGLVEEISFEPLGVIANISAWNYPYFVGSNVFIPALLTGNAVLYKPSEYAIKTGEHIVKLLAKAGLPDEVMPLITGTGAAGAALLQEPIDGVFFTGSYATGKKISQAVSDRLIKVQLELGGKDPVYVCEDMDPNVVGAAIGDGCFYNAGQSCCGVERIYVHEKIYDQFCASITAFAREAVVGDPTQEATYIGPLTRSEQLNVLEEQVADAKAKGGKVLCGGTRGSRSGNYFPPTVISNANHTMTLMREESFGPIIGIMPVKSDQEALTLMNDTDYGLTAGVYTRDQKRAEEILRQVNSGSVYWNCCDRVSPKLPWSGRKHSGMGWTLSTMGIDTFLRPKAWHWRQAK